VHDDLCTVLLKTGLDGFVSISYRGDVALLDNSLNVIDRAQAGEKIVRHGAISPDGTRVASCADAGLYNGIVDVWDVSQRRLTPLFTIRGNYRFPEFALDNRLFVLRESPVEERSGVGK
jgi:WD40 repeat protein